MSAGVLCIFFRSRLERTQIATALRGPQSHLTHQTLVSGVLAEFECFEHCVLKYLLLPLKKLPLFLKARLKMDRSLTIAKEIGRPASTTYSVLTHKNKILAAWQTGKASLDCSQFHLSHWPKLEATHCWSGFTKCEVSTLCMNGMLGILVRCEILHNPVSKKFQPHFSPKYVLMSIWFHGCPYYVLMRIDLYIYCI